jgi:hypothetical protein
MRADVLLLGAGQRRRLQRVGGVLAAKYPSDGGLHTAGQTHSRLSSARHEEPIHPQQPRRARLVARRAPPAQPLETPLSPLPSHPPDCARGSGFVGQESVVWVRVTGGRTHGLAPTAFPPHALLPFHPYSLPLPVSGSRQGQWCRGEQVRAASEGGAPRSPPLARC